MLVLSIRLLQWISIVGVFTCHLLAVTPQYRSSCPEDTHTDTHTQSVPSGYSSDTDDPPVLQIIKHNTIAVVSLVKSNF